ncbi:MAG: PilT/PilU family type 4a pilus ATPase [Elusimicrobia bacterium]|nr:PilT/PilU family type 4a pilus ATPase [Elusimicrobiota bacterium]
MAIDVNALLKLMLQKEISDIHFKADSHPALRYHGMMIPAANLPKLTGEDIKTAAYQLMTPEQVKEFEREMELDVAYSLEGVSRFRVNVFKQKGTIGLTLRVVPVKVRSFDELNLPVAPLMKLAGESRGLILFAGITGVGKTTTMNSFVNHLNTNYQYRIISIEDPIEFYHADVKSSIVQREVGKDTKCFSNALRHVLRQDPDVVVIGEMRDHETMAAALTAAETGHLVLSTIHTMNSTQTVDRIVDTHPVHQHNQVRQQLANCLKGVIGQRLVLSRDGKSRFPATEILIVNSLVRRHLLDGKPAEVYKVIESGSYYGMHSFDQDLLRLYSDGKIDEKSVIENANNPEDVALKIKSLAVGQQMADNPINAPFNG